MTETTKSWDTSSDQRFYKYFEEQSLSEATFQRMQNVRNIVLAARDAALPKEDLKVVDIGCGAGAACIIWANLGHRVFGLDINESLIELARTRAREAELNIEYNVGSATEAPWPDESMDICLVPELMEHVVDWEACLDEFARILKPNGILFLSTTNRLCPVQREFRLPLYSWYPNVAKQYLVKLARTTHPKIANYATYPAVNWFTFYGLRRFLDQRGFDCLDRFDQAILLKTGTSARIILYLIRNIPLLRLLGHVMSPSTRIVAKKRA